RHLTDPAYVAAPAEMQVEDTGPVEVHEEMFAERLHRLERRAIELTSDGVEPRIDREHACRGADPTGHLAREAMHLGAVRHARRLPSPAPSSPAPSGTPDDGGRSAVRDLPVVLGIAEGVDVTVCGQHEIPPADR